MILLILLTVLGIGVIGLGIGQYGQQEKGKHRPNRSKVAALEKQPNACQIKKELDDLLQRYHEGFLTEEAYLFRADELIDELTAFLDDNSPSTHWQDQLH